MPITTYRTLRETLEGKYRTHRVRYVDSVSTEGFVVELWVVSQNNEVDDKFLVVCPGMVVLQAYLSSFQATLRKRNKIVTEVVEGALTGQAIVSFRSVMDDVSGKAVRSVPGETFDVLEAVSESLSTKGFSYRHLLWDGRNLQSGLKITPKQVER